MSTFPTFDTELYRFNVQFWFIRNLKVDVCQRSMLILALGKVKLKNSFCFDLSVFAGFEIKGF